MRHVTLLAAVLGVLSGACGGGDDGGDPTRFVITGQLGSDFVTPSLLWARPADGQVVDQVVAVPFANHDLSLFDAQTFPVAADGGISVDLGRTSDWVLLLFDSTAVKENRFVAYVTIGSSDDSMMAFPVASAAPSAEGLDVGELSASGRDAEGTTTTDQTTDTFTLTLDQLQAIARTDNAFRNVVNDYLNAGEVYFRARPAFGFEAALATVGATPDDYAFNGFSVDIRTDDLAHFDVAALCAGTAELTLAPPAAFTTSNDTMFGPDAPLSSLGGTAQSSTYCTAPDMNFGVDDVASGQEFGMVAMANVGDTGRAPPPSTVPGWWRLAVDGSELAIFDFAVSDPTVDGHPWVPVPGLSVDTDTDGVITAVTVDYYQWDGGSSSYVLLDDLSTLARLNSYNFVELTGIGDEELLTGADHALLDRVVVPTKAWWTGAGTQPGGSVRVDHIDVGLTIGGVTFHFVWALQL